MPDPVRLHVISANSDWENGPWQALIHLGEVEDSIKVEGHGLPPLLGSCVFQANRKESACIPGLDRYRGCLLYNNST